MTSLSEHQFADVDQEVAPTLFPEPAAATVATWPDGSTYQLEGMPLGRGPRRAARDQEDVPRPARGRR
jgi:hypothetical protein